MTKLEKSEQIENFLSNFRKDTSTIRGYRVHLTKFFKVINKDPDKDYIKDPRLMENGDKIQYLDSIEQDVKQYWKYLIEEEKAKPKSITNAMSCLRVFFKQYRIRLDDVIWENIRKRGIGSKPVTRDKAPTKEILKEILEHGNAKYRALFLTWSCTGMREAELVQITSSDIDWDSDPVKIDIRHLGTDNKSVKTKYSRYVFITPESAHALKEWDKIIHFSENDDNRVFPWRPKNVRDLWIRLLKKSGYDNVRDKKVKSPQAPDGRRVYPANCIRKFFRTRMGRFDRDLTDFLMGHKHYLTENYLRMNEEEVAKLYKEGMKHLMIYETSVDTERVDSLEEQIIDKDKQIKDMQKIIDEMKLDILSLKVQKLEKANGIKR